MYDFAAQRHLIHHPEIAKDSLYTAVVCGEVTEVGRILAERPAAANEAGGARGWPPLLYLCYARFSHQPTIDNAVTIGRMLLDHGADPNAFYQAYNSRYTALVGVAGEGEQDAPTQPYAAELFQLLLERGAEPFDSQVLYNTHFRGDLLWWLKLVHAQTIRSGRKDAWKDPDWKMLDMGGYGSGSQFLLTTALIANNLELAEWCLAHGARPKKQPPPFDPKHARHKLTDLDSLYLEALRLDRTDFADLLVRYGAKPGELRLKGEEAFSAACMRLDRREVENQLREHPEYLNSPQAIFGAAQLDRDDVVIFLLELGTPIDVEDESGKRALHEAAGHNSLRVAKLLIERGAEIDPIERTWDAPPIGWAAHGDHQEMLDLISHFSHDIWRLCFRGYIDRLRELLPREPELARSVDNDGITPLWWLPDQEDGGEEKAQEVVRLLIAHGADPAAKSRSGSTAASWARKRGMLEVASMLERS